MAESTRLYPMTSVRLFEPGADGFCSDPGWWVRDILTQTWRNCRPSTIVSGGVHKPTTRLIHELGVVVPNFEVVPRDTLLTHWTGGSTRPSQPTGGWEDSTAQFAFKRRFCYQLYVYPDVDYWLDSDFDLPEDPWFSFTVGWGGLHFDELSTVEPYLNVVWGGGTWAIQWTTENGPQLFKADGGEWHWRMDLPNPWGKDWSMYPEGQEYKTAIVIVLHVRDNIAISFNGGESWATYHEPGGGAHAQQGPIRVEATGQAMQWWWNELRPLVPGLGDEKSSFESQLHPIFEDRLTTPTYILNDDYHKFAPEDTDVEVKRADTPELNVTAYEAEFTCDLVTTGGSPHSMYAFPALAGVDLYWDPVLVAPSPADYSDLAWSPGVVKVTVEQPDDLTANTAMIESLLAPDVTFEGEYRWRYVEIDTGFRYTNDSYEMWHKFAGYVDEVTTRQEPQWRQGHRLNLRMADATWRFKTSEIDEGFRPLDSMTVNEAILYLSQKCGWHVSRTDLVANTRQLTDGGAADVPLWHWEGPHPQLRVGMTVWDAMCLVADFGGVELFVSGDGVLKSRVRGGVGSTLHTFEGGATANLDDAVLSVEYSANVRDQGTRVIVRGEDQYGRAVAAYAVDFSRERVTTHVPFVGWKMARRIDGHEFRALPEAVFVANDQYDQMHESPYGLGLETAGNPEVSRRDQLQIRNVAVGTLVANRFLVTELADDWGPHLLDCASQFTARRVV